jgi:hypothetical protein
MVVHMRGGPEVNPMTTYKILYTIVDKDGKVLMAKAVQKCTTRVQVFDFLNGLDTYVNTRWAYKELGPLHCEDITIVEPTFETKVGNDGKEHTHKTGEQSFTPGVYATTYCRQCGCHLTDPKSVERGVGPECWKKVH